MEGKIDEAAGGVNFVGVEMSMWFVGVVAVGTGIYWGSQFFQSEMTHYFLTVTFLFSSLSSSQQPRHHSSK